MRGNDSIIKNFAADFEQSCDGGPTLHGVIRYNAEQTGAGEFDFDNDGVLNLEDNCPDITNPGQIDADVDAVGDECDLYPDDASESGDADNDNVGNNADLDDDNDGFADKYDAFPYDSTESLDLDVDGIGNNSDTDDDGDDVPDATDNCPLMYNPLQTDQNNDGVGDGCEDSRLLQAVIAGKNNNKAGWSLAFAGDFNGDGIGDFVVGMPDYDKPISVNAKIRDAGHAEVISGNTGQVLASIDGISKQELVGFSVAGNGDIDNDGFDDVVIGAPLVNVGEGRVTILYGPDGVRRYSMSSGRDRTLFGYAVALADINNDSHADILIGAPTDDDFRKGLNDVGTVKLISGNNLYLLGMLYGTTVGAHSGVSITTGKVDAINGAEVIVGAPDDDDLDNGLKDAGSVSVFNIANMDMPIMKKFGAGKNAYLGVSLASSDIDHDGHDEIVVGAPGDKDLVNRHKKAGSVTVFSGNGGAVLTKKYGDVAKAESGISVAVGDINGDGYDDIIAGAALDDDVASKTTKKLVDAGSVSIWSGNGYGQLGSKLYGDHAKDWFGYAVSAGDIDNDGIDDLIVGIPGFDVPATPTTKKVKGAGAVKVFSGARL